MELQEWSMQISSQFHWGKEIYKPSKFVLRMQIITQKFPHAKLITHTFQKLWLTLNRNEIASGIPGICLQSFLTRLYLAQNLYLKIGGTKESISCFWVWTSMKNNPNLSEIFCLFAFWFLFGEFSIFTSSNKVELDQELT